MSHNQLSQIKQARRAKIVAAAEQRFVTEGFRATTMEAVAHAAGVSKVTLYNYFKDKDLLFDAVASVIAADMQSAFDVALAADGPIEERITDALIVKHSIVRVRVRQSAFAAELFAIKNRASAVRFKALDDGFMRQISNALAAAGIDGHAAEQLAETVFAASQGIANAARDQTQMSDQIRLLATLIAAKTS